MDQWTGVSVIQVVACHQTDELVQERCNSSALAMELCLSCSNPSKQAITWTNTDLLSIGL